MKKTIALLVALTLVLSAAAAGYAAAGTPARGGDGDIYIPENSDVWITREHDLVGLVAGTKEDYVSLTALREQVQPANTDNDLVFTDAEGITIQDETQPAATGMKVVVVNTESGTEVDSVTIIVMGDVTGTGLIALTQLVRMSQCFRGEIEITGPYFTAANWTGSGTLTLTDIVKEAELLRGETPAVPTPPQGPDPTPTPTASTSPIIPTPDPYAALRTEAIALTNSLRTENGAGTVQMNALLNEAAQTRAAEMAAWEQLSAERPNGASAYTVVTLGGPDVGDVDRGKGEVVAEVPAGVSVNDIPSRVLNRWTNSAGNKEIMLTEEYVCAGFGLAQSVHGNWYVCEYFTNTDDIVSVAAPIYPDPMPTPTPAPSSTATPAPTPSPSGTAAPTSAPTGSPTPTPTGTPTVAPTQQPSLSPGPAPSVSPGLLSEVEEQMLALTNELREAAGAPALAANAQLSEGARVRAEEMAAWGNVSDRRPDGTDGPDVIVWQPGVSVSSGELVNSAAITGGDRISAETVARSMIDAWANQEIQKATLANSKFSFGGVGVAVGADGKWYFCELLTSSDQIERVLGPVLPEA